MQQENRKKHTWKKKNRTSTTAHRNVWFWAGMGPPIFVTTVHTQSNMQVNKNCIKYIKWHNEMRERPTNRKKQQDNNNNTGSEYKKIAKKDAANREKKIFLVPFLMRSDFVCMHINATKKNSRLLRTSEKVRRFSGNSTHSSNTWTIRAISYKTTKSFECRIFFGVKYTEYATIWNREWVCVQV